MPATRFVASSLWFFFPFLSFVSFPVLTTVFLSLPQPAVSNTVQQSFWKADADVAGQQTLYLRNHYVHCDVYTISPMDPNVKQFNPIHALTPSLIMFLVVQQPYSGQGRLIVEVSRSFSDTPHTVGLLWTRDRPRPLSDNTQHSQQTDFILPARFEPAVPPSERPQSCALNSAVSGTDAFFNFQHNIIHLCLSLV